MFFLNPKINKYLVNIVIDYLLPNKEKIDFTKLKLVKSIDFEFKHYMEDHKHYRNNFKYYFNTVIKEYPIEIVFYFNNKLRSWISKT